MVKGERVWRIQRWEVFVRVANGEKVIHGGVVVK